MATNPAPVSIASGGTFQFPGVFCGVKFNTNTRWNNEGSGGGGKGEERNTAVITDCCMASSPLQEMICALATVPPGTCSTCTLQLRLEGVLAGSFQLLCTFCLTTAVHCCSSDARRAFCAPCSTAISRCNSARRCALCCFLAAAAASALSLATRSCLAFSASACCCNSASFAFNAC